LELNPCEIKVNIADGWSKNAEGVVESDDQGREFTLPIKIVVIEMEGMEKFQLILGRPFFVTASAIIDVEQGEILIRSKDLDKIKTIKINNKLMYIWEQ